MSSHFSLPLLFARHDIQIQPPHSLPPPHHQPLSPLTRSLNSRSETQKRLPFHYQPGHKRQTSSTQRLPFRSTPLDPFIHTKLQQFLLHHLQRQPSSGLSGELCTTDQQCAPPRRCIDVQSSTPCSTSSGCLCLPPDPVDLICACRDTECLEGDVCSVVGSDNMCVSPVRGFPRVDCGGPGNFTAEACSRDSDCAGPRECLSDEDPSQPCSEPPCSCFPIDFEDLVCSCSEPECLEGDRCTDFGGKLVGCATAPNTLPSLVCDSNEIHRGVMYK